MKNTLYQKTAHQNIVIVAGDFNQMINPDTDYYNEKFDELKPETKERKKEKKFGGFQKGSRRLQPFLL